MCNVELFRTDGQSVRRMVADECDDCGTPFVVSAALYGMNGIVALLIEHGARATTSDVNGWTAAMGAAYFGAEHTVEHLVSNCGARLSGNDVALIDSMTTVTSRVWATVTRIHQKKLLKSVWKGELGSVMRELSQNAYTTDSYDVLNVSDNRANTALHIACAKDDVDIVESIVYYLANATTPWMKERHWKSVNNVGVTPLGAALLSQSQHVLWYCANQGMKIGSVELDAIRTLRRYQPWPATLKTVVARLTCFTR